MLCYCHSKKPFENCCQPLLSGLAIATTCEQLMRSRYSAYCQHDINYVYHTYHQTKRNDNPLEALTRFANSCHFIQLELSSAEQTDKEGYVTFSVRYLQDNLLCRFSERSRFVYDNGWYYIDGELQDSTPIKLGRNELCPCGSGKKFKYCSEHLSSGN